jgi:UDP-glucose 4-epimerase
MPWREFWPWLGIPRPSVGSSDFEITIEDLARKIKSLAGSKSEIRYIPYEDAYEKGFEDMVRRLPDIGPISSLTGYKPKVSLDEMLRKVIEYHKQ